MASSTTSPPASSSSTSWSDLPPELLGLVLIRLPLPADRARFRAVCRAWQSAARHHVGQLPWIVFPDGSFGTMGRTMRRVDAFYFPAGIPGLPDNVTCLGAAADGWLALDCTDDVFRRTHHWDKYSDNRFLQPRRDVKHRHSYRLYNPFTGKTVLLPELDSIIGEVAETFEIRKVLMRPSSSSSSDSPDDELVAIITNSYNYNIILCRPEKGSCVLPNIDVFDIAFCGEKLYGITPKEELVALDLAMDDNGAPIVTKCRRVIKKPLPDGEEDHRSWMYDDNSSDDDDNNNDGGLSSSSSASASDNDDDDDDGDDDDDDDDDNDDDATLSQNGEEGSFNGDGLVPSGEDRANVEDEERPYDIAITTRRLVQSSRGDGNDGELFMVRHHTESSARYDTYTLDVDILKADIDAGNWVPVNELAEGEAFFLSRSFSKAVHAYGDIKEGFIYYIDAGDVFDTKSSDCSLIRFPGRWQGASHKLLTWLFPPELQL